MARKPTLFQWMWGMGDYPEWEAYRDKGGKLDYNTWSSSGKPSPRQGALSAYGASRLPSTFAPTSPVDVAPPTPGENVLMQWRAQTEADQAMQGFTQAPGGLDGNLPPNIYKTYEEALAAAPKGWEPELTELGYWSFRRVPEKAGASDMPFGFFKSYKDAAVAAPEGYIPRQTAQGWWSLERAMSSSEQAAMEQQQRAFSLQEQQFTQRQRESADQLGIQQEELALSRQTAQSQQAERERQYRSQLMANPMSWLQYNAYAGTQPLVQPWMTGLNQNLQTGQAIPGFTAGAEGQPINTLPQLTTPSAQYFARMGPTAQQQYLGYEQSRTGAIPDETLFRQRAGSAPSGRYAGLRWLS